MKIMQIGSGVNAILLLTFLAACNHNPQVDKRFPAVESRPSIFEPNNISTAEFHESGNGFSKDGQTFYFTRSDRQFKTSTLYSSSFQEGAWATPEVLSFSGTHYDAGLRFSPEGDLAFFTSKRPPGRTDLSAEWNIWRVPFADGQWGTAEVLPAPVNSDSLECCLVMNGKGKAYSSSNRAGSWDIYEAEFKDGTFHNVQKLTDGVNTSGGEWPGHINEEGDLLLFSSIRKTGLGGDDLYRARKAGNVWAEVTLLDSTINSASYEDSPLFSSDGLYFFFSSWKETDFSEGRSNIYLMLAPL